MMTNQLKYILLLFLFTSYSFNLNSQDVQKVDLGCLENLYQLNSDVYRSDQPNRISMQDLEYYGVKSILSLRFLNDDSNEAKGTNLKLFSVPMFAWNIKYEDVLKAMKILNEAPKPILIHCYHGSDRTGLIIALYRLINNKWSKQDAMFELKQKKFGYHSFLFPNIENFILELDISQFKKDLEDYQL